MSSLKPQIAENIIEAFKKDENLLLNYLESKYDLIAKAENKRLNIFTSNPSDYKDKVLSSLANLDKDGPLYGLAFVAKDNINTKDFPTSAGTPALESFTPKADAAIIDKLKKAGAVLIGKTNMHELAVGITSENAHFGAVRNPYDPLKFAGGCSGGTAVAIATDIVSVGLGTDKGGSCRIPAALCGIFGFRPSSGRYDAEGIVPLSASRDTIGLLAKHIEDMILLDSIITDKKNEETIDLPSLRIGIPRKYFYEGLSKEVKKISENTITKLKDKNIQLIEVNIDGIQDLLNESINMGLNEIYEGITGYLKKYNTGISYSELVKDIASMDVKFIFDAGVVTENPDISAALEEIEKLKALYKTYFESNNLDAILCPTTPLAARPIKDSLGTIELNGEQEATFPTYIRNTNPSSYAGMPGITIPAGLTKDGLPVGMHLEGRINSDARLMRIAAAVYDLIK